jgi:LysR family glycine cleavage system transcriptional activator
MLLLREEIFPVCSPELASGLRSPSALLEHTLIECGACDDATEAHWDHWITKLRLQSGSEPRRLHFSHFGTALTAALDGLGVVLGRSPMVDVELAAGRLVRPFDKKVVAKAAKLFVLQWHDFSDQRVTAFRDFALDEACGCELAAGPCGMPPSEQDARTQNAWSAARATRRMLTHVN